MTQSSQSTFHGTDANVRFFEPIRHRSLTPSFARHSLVIARLRQLAPRAVTPTHPCLCLRHRLQEHHYRRIRHGLHSKRPQEMFWPTSLPHRSPGRSSTFPNNVTSQFLTHLRPFPLHNAVVMRPAHGNCTHERHEPRPKPMPNGASLLTSYKTSLSESSMCFYFISRRCHDLLGEGLPAPYYKWPLSVHTNIFM